MQIHKGNSFAEKRLSLAVGVGLLALLIGMGTPVHAQEQTEPSQSVEPASRVPVIVVSATKREQTLQETPVAVSVVGAEEIERAEIQDLSDLQTLVPSLAVRQEQTSGATNFFIRGFGNGSNAVGLEPSVGVFIDGVYRSRSVAAISDLPNLERVEVLRGPQSTLFGKNASAGVISVTTRKPQFEPEAMIETSRGNFNAFRLEGYATGPITETLAVSLAGNLNRRDGYADDPATGAEYNERDRWGLRGDILFEPTPDVSFRLIADYDEIDEDCCIITNVVDGPTGAAVRALGGQFTSEDPFAYEAFYDIVPTSRIENSGVSLQGDIGLGFGNLSSITAFRNNESRSQFDPDATNLQLFDANTQDTQIQTFTQEIRLSSVGAGNRIDWMIGGFYFDEAIDVDNSLFYGPAYRPFINALTGNPNALSQLEAFARIPPNSLALPGQGTVDTISQDNTAWSIFGTVDFNITDRLTATFGINYTEDRKDVAIDIISNDALAMLNLDQLGYNAALGTILAQNGINLLNPASILPFIQGNPALYGQIQQQALAGATGPLNPFNPLRALQLLPGFVNFPNSVEDGRTRDDSTDFTFRLAYDVTDDINVYASYATGFKASSWNLSRQSRPFASDFTAGNRVVDPVTMQVLQATPSSPITDAGLGFT
ncbi:MAG: TonB-dependent receptor, partial [Pseudomonadota bacterium]